MVGCGFGAKDEINDFSPIKSLIEYRPKETCD